jgi:hypothetical protein
MQIDASRAERAVGRTTCDFPSQLKSKGRSEANADFVRAVAQAQLNPHITEEALSHSDSLDLSLESDSYEREHELSEKHEHHGGHRCYQQRR